MDKSRQKLAKYHFLSLFITKLERWENLENTPPGSTLNTLYNNALSHMGQQKGGYTLYIVIQTVVQDSLLAFLVAFFIALEGLALPRAPQQTIY